ncbi:hypothetical protein IWQ62_006692, partial [Dispira parvispora]
SLNTTRRRHPLLSNHNAALLPQQVLFKALTLCSVIASNVGSHPLQLWDVCLPARSNPSENQGRDSSSTSDDDSENEVQIVDSDVDIAGPVLILRSETVGTVYISCPSDATRELGIVLPILGLLVKPHPDEYFAVEVLVRDQRDYLYRLRAINVQTQVYQTPALALVPLRLVSGWNQVQFDLRSVLFQVYGAKYRETLR